MSTSAYTGDKCLMFLKKFYVQLCNFTNDVLNISIIVVCVLWDIKVQPNKGLMISFIEFTV